MKNILIICSKLASEQTGGVQTRIENYNKNLPKFDIQPIFLSLSKYDNIQNNKGFYKYPKNFSNFNFIVFLFKLISRIKIIHILENPLGQKQIISFLLGKLFFKKIYISIYGGEVWDIDNSKDFIKKIKLQLILRFASKIIVNSKSTLNILSERNQKKSAIVYPGVNSKLLRHANKIRLDSNKYINLLYVGRLIRRKGLDDIIKALNIVSKKYSNIHLSVIGKKHNMDYFQSLVGKYDLVNYINFIGEVHDIEELADYYKKCNIFLMTPKLVYNPPCGFESFGCVYLEAGLFKKPVIGTTHFGVKEAVIHNKTGLLVPENNPQEIAQAIMKLINNPSLKIQLGNNNYKRTIDNFMDINSTRQLASTYKQ